MNDQLNLAADTMAEWLNVNTFYSGTKLSAEDHKTHVSVSGYYLNEQSLFDRWLASGGTSGYFQDLVWIVERSNHLNFFVNWHHSTFRPHDTFLEVGIAFLVGPISAEGQKEFDVRYFSRTGFDVFITGVVINDNDGDRFYDIGEGVGGVLLSVTGGASDTTGAAGGYEISVAAGARVVTVGAVTVGFAVGTSNIKLDILDTKHVLTDSPVISYSGAASVTLLGFNNVGISGGTGPATLIGNRGNNIIVGSTDNDAISGMDGDDIIAGGTGTNVVDGGDGYDTADYTGLSRTGLSIRISSGKVEISGLGRIDSWQNVEGFFFREGLITLQELRAPFVSVADSVINLTRANAAPLLSGLLSVTDADGDAIQRWQVWDATPGNGAIVKGGVRMADIGLTDLTAAEFATASYGSAGGYDQLWARAFDGTDWSAWTSFWVVAPVNTAPVVNAPFAFLNRTNANPALSSLWSLSDADGDTAQRWQIWDATAGNGAIQVGGVDRPAQSLVDLTAGEFATANYRSAGGWDQIWVRAFDGFDWSAWTQTYVVAPVNAPPVVSASSAKLPNGVLNLSLPGLVSATDAEGDAIQRWQIWDVTTDGGALLAKGAHQSAMTQVELTASEFSAAQISGGAAGDSYWIRGFDGFDWSNWTNFTVTAPGSNTAPLLSPAATAFNGSGASRTLTSVFSYADVQGHAAQRYELWDNSPGNGFFSVNGAQQAARTVIGVSSSQLATATFTSGEGDDDVWVRAWDGFDWGAWTYGRLDNILV
jgi:hypothetical protein